MTDLIANGEALLSVRQKLNATLRPYASRAEFEAATIPAAVTLVNAIDGEQVMQLVRDAGGTWTSGDGAKWLATVLASIAVADLDVLVTAAEEAAGAAGAYTADAYTAKAGAEAARDAAFVSANVYASTAAGLAAVAVGGQFQVVIGDDIVRYRVDAGPVAVEVARYPAAAKVAGLVPIAPQGYAFSVVDDAGKASFGVLNDGTTRAGNFEADEFRSSAIETDALSLDGVAMQSAAPAGWAWVIVDEDGNGPGGFKDDGTFSVAAVETQEIVAETINGAPATWIPSQNMLGTYASDIAHIISYGQSLSLGNGALNIQTLTQKFDSIMFNAGVRAQEGSLGVAGNRASFVPLVESVTSVTGNGETPVGNAAATIKRLIEAENTMDFTQQDYQLLGSAPGVGNNTITMLSKGGTGYTNLITDVTYGLQNSAALGKSYAVPTVFWSQGERDYDPAFATSYEAYLAKFLQLYTDLNTDIKAITGQPDDIKIIGYQACYTAPMPVALAQLQATKDNPNILIAAPIYAMEKTAPGNVHLSSRGSALLGAYYGLVHKRAVIDRKPWAPVQPVKVWRQGAIIMARFNVPTRPLVLDTTLLSAAPNYGFSLVDNLGADLTISSVSIAGPDTVRIVASAAIPAGAKLRYAFVLNADGWNGGNLRDSQGDYINDGLEISPRPLHNWGVAFEETLL